MKGFLTAAALMVASVGAQAAECNAILDHGLWNSRYYSSEYDRAARARDWYCNYYRNEASNQSDNSLFLGIDGFGLDFGFSDNGQKLTVSQVCEDTFKSAEERSRVTDVWRVASDVIVGAWLECQKQTAGFEGVRAWVNTTADPAQFDLELRFSSNAAAPGATISNAILRGANCESPNGLTFNDKSKFLLTRPGATALCDRRCPTDQVRIAFASDHPINHGKNTTTITVPGAAEPPVGTCQVVFNKPTDTWTFKGECVEGGAPAPVSLDGEGKTGTISYAVGVAPPDKLGARCGGFVCTPLGDNNGCAFIFGETESRPNDQTVRVTASYNSHVVFLSSGYQRLVYANKPTPEAGKAVSVAPGKLFSISFPTSNLGVSVACSLNGDGFEFDPQADFTNSHLKFVSRHVAGDTTIVNFQNLDRSQYACPAQ